MIVRLLLRSVPDTPPPIPDTPPALRHSLNPLPPESGAIIAWEPGLTGQDAEGHDVVLGEDAVWRHVNPEDDEV